MGILAEAFVPVAFSGVEKFKAQMGDLKNSISSNLTGPAIGSFAKIAGALGVAFGATAVITKSIHNAMQAEERLDSIKSLLTANAEAVDSNAGAFDKLAASAGKVSSKTVTPSVGSTTATVGVNVLPTPAVKAPTIPAVKPITIPSVVKTPTIPNLKPPTMPTVAVKPITIPTKVEKPNIEAQLNSYKEWTQNISKTTMATKGEAGELYKQALQYGKTGDEAKKYATTSIGLAAKMGISQQEALEMLMRLSDGDTRAVKALSHKSAAIANATTQQELMDAITKESTVGMQMQNDALKTTAGKMNQAEKSISSLYTSMGSALLPVVGAVCEGFTELFDWIGGLIGHVTAFNATLEQSTASFSLWEGFKNIVKWIGKEIENVVFVFANWDQYMKILGIEFAEFFTHIWERTANFGRNIAVFIGWFFDNWKGVLVDVGNYFVSIFTNAMEYLKKLFSALWKWVKSGFKGSMEDVGELDLTKGYKRTVEGPKYEKLELSDFSGQYAEAGKELQKRETKWEETDPAKKQKTQEERKKMVAADIGGLSLGTGKTTEKGKAASFTGLADMWKKAQESVLKGNEDRIAKQQRGKMVEHLGTIATATKTMAKQPKGARAA